MKFLFQKKVLIIISVIILFCMILSVLYQQFFVDSRNKRLHQAISNAYLVKYNTYVSDTICDITKEHDFTNYIFCGYEDGCYFGLEKKSDDTEIEINNFIRKGVTVIKKQENDSIVYFINKSDTLTVIYNIDYETNCLERGIIYTGQINK